VAKIRPIWSPCLHPRTRVARFFLIQIYQIGKNITNDHKLYQTAINYTYWPYNIPNGHKIYQHLPFKGSQKFTQMGIFGLKTNHLATLPRTERKLQNEETVGRRQISPCFYVFGCFYL
jgi:hypothetical protein